MESSIESQTMNLGIGNVPPPPSPNPSPSPPSPPNPPHQIYYLTSDATEILWRPRPNATYIVGGIVDRNRFPQLALNRAKEIGVKTVRFPLEESLADLGHMHRHRILTTNKAVELLVEVVISTSGVQRKNVDMDHNVHKEPDQEQQQKESNLVDESVCRDVDHTMSKIAFEEEKEKKKKKKKRGIVVENDGNDDDEDDSDVDDHDDNDDDVESESLKVIWKKAIDKILLQRPLQQPYYQDKKEKEEKQLMSSIEAPRQI
jgi:hypothetical protein